MAWADLTDVQCYYELLGEGDPLLLIPGLGTTCRLWDGIAPELAQHFSLILPDNRDVGKSIGKTRTPRMLSDFSADLIELLDRLQIERAHVLGISLGGVIAQRLAIDHPGRVNRLVLVSCSNHFWPYLTEMTKLLGKMVGGISLTAYQRTMELLGTAPEYFDAHQDRINQKIAAAKKSRISRRAVLRQLRCLAASEPRPDEYRIESPTLVLSGEYDVIVPHCYASRMARDIPGSVFELVSNCGHNPLDEAPDRVLPRVIKFLESKPNQRLGDDSGEEGRAGERGRPIRSAYAWTDRQCDSLAEAFGER